MAERNIMNVLYKLRGDTLNNWSTKNPVLAEREPAIVIIPADSNSGLNEPAVLLKIGDGTTAFNDLGYLSAIAGDVPAWAKEANKPSYEAKEITGIDAYIAAYVNEQMGISVDTDTQYTIVAVEGNAYQYKLMSKSKADEQFATEVAVIDIPKYDAAEYTIEKAAESGEYAAIYTLMKNGVQAGAAINIPKDMVVESGSVVENPEGQAEGTYIKLVLQNVAEPLYINVGSLIEYVTSGSQTGDMVVITVSDDHKVTATITDGSITLAKLATEIQTAIGKAHSHENAAVLAGITEQKIVDWDDAVAKEHEHANKDVLDGIDEAKVAGWDAAEQNAKDHADDLNEAMDTRVKALEDVGATKVEASETNGNIKINGTETPVYVLPASVLDAGDTFIFDGGNA